MELGNSAVNLQASGKAPIALALLVMLCCSGCASSLSQFRPQFRSGPRSSARADSASPVGAAKVAHRGSRQWRQSCGVAALKDIFPGIRSAVAASKDERIIGGITAQRGQWPWIVSLTYDGVARCGATIISERYLLTAAHCFRDKPDVSLWSADFASLDFLQPNEPGEFWIRLAGYQMNPNYGRFSRDDFDVAVAELVKPVTFSDLISPICLSNRVALPGELCTVAGWGTVRAPEPYNLLNHVSVPIIPARQCNSSAFPDLTGRITDSMFCAGYPQGGKDACGGDSGAPIMCRRGEAWYQFGVVSWGSGCGDPNAPGVYARTDGDVKQWIESVVGKPL